ncbi:MAG: hypothetical protein KIS77_00170 [Saprospiraceae bacterium]|nr:hypothetical protein [Saprospiraceae bacterium]
MSFDNSMNQMYSLKQFYIDLGWMPKFLPIFNAAGAYIRTIWRGEKLAGAHQIEMEVGDLPPGIYVARLTTKTGVASRLMTVVR